MYFQQLEPRRLLAGVTIITHGNAGTITGWVDSAADAIQDRLGGTSAASQYVMKVDGGGVQSLKLEDGNKPLDQTSKAEAIIKLDWSDISNTSNFTDDIGQDVASYLLTSHEGVPDFTQLPFHLIGHSRGASLMVSLSYNLGRFGLWVDQVTNLDPHPIDKIDIPFIDDIGDAEMETFENVLFSDTYYRNGGNDVIDPHGEAVNGSHNVNLNNSVQKKNLFSAHMGVTAYYHGTIDLDAKANKDAPIYSEWYKGTAEKPARDETGYVFSHAVGGERPLDGVGQAWGGTADRTGVKFKGSQYSNVTSVRVVGTTVVGLNQPITLKGIYNDRDSSAKVTFFFDDDRNPYNSNTAKVLGTTSVAKSEAPRSATMRAKVSGIGEGDYFLGAKISDADGHVRYAYASSAISVERADFASFSNGVLSIKSTSKSDTIIITGDASTMHVTRNGLMQTIDTPGIERATVDGGDGDDTIRTEVTDVPMYAFGGDGNDAITGGGANDTLSGGAGKNTLSGRDGNDRLNGSGGRDFIFGGAGDDRLYGNGGNDTLDGGGNVDHLFGGDGDDRLDGGTSNDKLYGEAGDDTLLGAAQNDLLEGGSGNDSLVGGEGRDTFRGNTGDDVIDSRDGLNEPIDAGSGTDQARMDEGDMSVSVETVL